MGFYSKYIYPKIIESILSTPSVMKHRKDILSNVRGEILEIGFGTGLNLPCYPHSIKEITALDTNDGMNLMAKKRMQLSQIKVNFELLNAKKLPFKDGSFDSIVSTFTFCSIENINEAMKEFFRVLKPSGQLLFLEHGLSPDKNIAFTQNYFNPFYRLFSEGCNLNRNIKSIVEENNFKINQLDEFYLDHVLKPAGYLYKGIAMKM